MSGDIKVLLHRNGTLNDFVSKYVDSVVENCPSCRSSSQPQPSRKVSLASLSRSFKDLVCIDHFFLETPFVMHAMEAHTRYSAAALCSSTSVDEAVEAFTNVLLSPFLNPHAVQIYSAFNNGDIRELLDRLEITSRVVPPSRHSKNAIES